MKLEKYLTKEVSEENPIHHGKQVILKRVSVLTATEVNYGIISFKEHHQIQKAIKKILKI